MASNDKLLIDHIGLLVSIEYDVFYIRFELIVRLSMYWIDLEVCLRCGCFSFSYSFNYSVSQLRATFCYHKPSSSLTYPHCFDTNGLHSIKIV